VYRMDSPSNVFVINRYNGVVESTLWNRLFSSGKSKVVSLSLRTLCPWCLFRLPSPTIVENGIFTLGIRHFSQNPDGPFSRFPKRVDLLGSCSIRAAIARPATVFVGCV